jgi:predicted CoA-substrate-specific enzyme activase
MAFVGIDVGAQSIKLVILKEENIFFSKVIHGKGEETFVDEGMVEDILKESGLSYKEVFSILATGVGKSTAYIADKKKSEQICHARGAYWKFPSVRTVLDIGAEGSRAMKLDEAGRVVDFTVNSKCAAGTGTFLEAMAKIMDLPIEEIGRLAVEATGKARISSYCAVFAESEVISNIHKGISKEHIISGIHESVVDRLVELLNMVKMKEDLVVCGGVAKNIGVIKALEKRIHLKVWVPEKPEIVGALGGALIAQDLYQKPKA